MQYRTNYGDLVDSIHEYINRILCISLIFKWIILFTAHVEENIENIHRASKCS